MAPMDFSLPPAVEAFRAVDCAGLARIDFLVSGEDAFLSEMNTLPGFTATSMYPKQAELAGIVVEPVLQGAGGMHVYDAACLRVMREVADLSIRSLTSVRSGWVSAVNRVESVIADLMIGKRTASCCRSCSLGTSGSATASTPRACSAGSPLC